MSTYVHPDLEELQRAYDNLIETSSANGADSQAILEASIKLCVTDAKGYVWRIGIDGEFVRSSSKDSPAVKTDPSQYANEPNAPTEASPTREEWDSNSEPPGNLAMLFEEDEPDSLKSPFEQDTVQDVGFLEEDLTSTASHGVPLAHSSYSSKENLDDDDLFEPPSSTYSHDDFPDLEQEEPDREPSGYVSKESKFDFSSKLKLVLYYVADHKGIVVLAAIGVFLLFGTMAVQGSSGNVEAQPNPSVSPVPDDPQKPSKPAASGPTVGQTASLFEIVQSGNRSAVRKLFVSDVDDFLLAYQTAMLYGSQKAGIKLDNLGVRPEVGGYVQRILLTDTFSGDVVGSFDYHWVQNDAGFWKIDDLPDTDFETDGMF